MAEQVELFEININVDAAVKDSKRLSEEIEVLKSQTNKAQERSRRVIRRVYKV